MEEHEEITIITKWGRYKHKRPSNRGMIIVISIAILAAIIAIVWICKHA